MRAFDRVMSLVLALAGLTIGVLVIVEVVYRALGNSGHLVVDWEPLSAYFRDRAWSAVVVSVIAAALLVLGLLLLVAELAPRRPGLLVLRSVHPDVTAGIPRRSVGRTLEAAALAVPGVDKASAAVRGGRVSLRGATALEDTGPLQTQVTERVERATQGLQLRRPPSVSVRIRKQ